MFILSVYILSVSDLLLILLLLFSHSVVSDTL